MKVKQVWQHGDHLVMQTHDDKFYRTTVSDAVLARPPRWVLIPEPMPSQADYDAVNARAVGILEEAFKKVEPPWFVVNVDVSGTIQPLIDETFQNVITARENLKEQIQMGAAPRERAFITAYHRTADDRVEGLLDLDVDGNVIDWVDRNQPPSPRRTVIDIRFREKENT